MLAGGNFILTPVSRKMWMALEKDRENLFFIDAGARGLPAYLPGVSRKRRGDRKSPGDDEILKNTVDFVSSAITHRAAPAEMNAGNTSRQHREVAA
jgi:6-phospho-beta-glucosidase